jgi:hypothetical protein
LNEYFAKHINFAKATISVDINPVTVDRVVRVNLLHQLTDKGSIRFLEYYFKTLENEDYFLTMPTFFREFKYRYSLQGIDNYYLDRLESSKKDIIQLIHNDKLADLYFDYFAKAMLKHGTSTVTRDLGSFFAKFVHTFKPGDYCALDNPIRNYFGLQRESFFVAFSIISSAYKVWASENQAVVKEIREKFHLIDSKGMVKHDRVTDLKLLDMIYWSKANTG